MKKLILILTLVLGIGVNAQIDLYVGIDLTDSTLIKQYKVRALKEINEYVINNGDDGIHLTLFPISNNAGNESKRISLKEASFWDGPVIRQNDIKAFVKLVKRELDGSKYSRNKYPTTRIYDNLIRYKDVKNPVIFILSDLFDNYSNSKEYAPLMFKHITFIRGISPDGQLDMKYISNGDAMEQFWNEVIPNVNITQ